MTSLFPLKHCVEISVFSEINDFDGSGFRKCEPDKQTHGDSVMASSACPLSGLRLPGTRVRREAQTAHLPH